MVESDRAKSKTMNGLGASGSEYVSGGYYVARLPRQVLSASPCICEFFPDVWAIEWTSESVDGRSKQAAAFGISTKDLPNVIAWATGSFTKTFGWPNAFYTLEAAQKACASFLPDDPEIVVFGLGLHHSDVEGFLKAAQPEPAQPGYAPVGETGVFQCVSSAKKVVTGGDAAGFELLATFSGLLTCSWLCNGLEKDCAAQLGIVLNSRGFVDSYSDALRCAEFISRDETRAEPGLWLPWLVTIYATESDPMR
jgi:hypothetical protein